MVSALRRIGLTINDENVNANPVSDGYSLNVRVDGADVSAAALENELRSLRGVTTVVNVSAPPRVHTHDLRRSRVAEDTERERRAKAAERVDAVVKSYPLILPEVRAYEKLVAGSSSSLDLVRNFGVRCGRLVAASERRFEGVESLDHAFDKVLVGFLFPIARLKIDGYNLRIADSVFTEVEDQVASDSERAATLGPCTFLEGMIEGMLNHAPGLPGVRVEETRCKSLGHRECRFRVDPTTTDD